MGKEKEDAQAPVLYSYPFLTVSKGGTAKGRKEGRRPIVGSGPFILSGVGYPPKVGCGGTSELIASDMT